jgi:hypothetical protein
MEDLPLDTVENTHFCDMIIAHDADAKKLFRLKKTFTL